MKTIGILGLSMVTLATAQNAAVSSYLNPDDDFAGDIRIKEVRVPTNGYAVGTYWCVLGWRGTGGGPSGYGGIQYTSSGNNYIYSIWNDNVTADYLSPNMIFRTFGGEGTGYQSITYNYPWSTGYWNVLADRVWDVGDKTHSAFFVKDGKSGVWRHLITMVVPVAHMRYGSYSYNFLEDYHGNGYYRQSQIRRGWKRRDDNKSWFPITKANYSVNTADLSGRSINKSTNWAGGTSSDATGPFFFMEAGGAIPSSNNAGTTYTLARTATAPQEEYGTARVSQISALVTADNTKLIVSWTMDSLTVPQFATKISIIDSGLVVATVADTLPQRRSDTLDISNLAITAKRYTVTLAVTDMFEGKAAPVSAQFGGSITVTPVTRPGKKKPRTRSAADMVEGNANPDSAVSGASVTGIAGRGFDSRLRISGRRLYIRGGSETTMRILTASGKDTRTMSLTGKQGQVVDLDGLKLKPGLYVASLHSSEGDDVIKFVVP
jgi:hypothetical protein